MKLSALLLTVGLILSGSISAASYYPKAYDRYAGSSSGRTYRSSHGHTYNDSVLFMRDNLGGGSDGVSNAYVEPVHGGAGDKSQAETDRRALSEAEIMALKAKRLALAEKK